MNILIASHSYPSVMSKLAGSFVHNQARFLQRHCSLRVVSPTPWFPLPGFGRWSVYRTLPVCDSIDGINVVRPSYCTFPRRILFSSVWRSYARALETEFVSKESPDVYNVRTGALETDRIRLIQIRDENQIEIKDTFNDFVDEFSESNLPIISIQTNVINDAGFIDDNNPLIDKPWYCPGFANPITGLISDNEDEDDENPTDG